MSADFAGQVAVVSGAASGIGQAMAALLLDRGARVAGVDLTAEGVPPGVAPYVADVAQPDAVRLLHEQVTADLGPASVLMNNAGIGSTTDVLSCTADEWDRVFAVNVRSVLLMTQVFLPGMLERRAGSIVNTASVLALIGAPDRAAYSAAKGAVVALTRQVAVQYAGTGVRCNCICPGTVDSPWVARLLAAADDPDEALRRLVARQPVGRLGTAAEVARAAVYLASAEADFVTGSSLVIDGGYSAG